MKGVKVLMIKRGREEKKDELSVGLGRKNKRKTNKPRGQKILKILYQLTHKNYIRK